MATIVYYLTYSRLPALDSYSRPLFAYGQEIHETCERHTYYEHNQFVQAWGDAGFFKIAYGECGIDTIFAPFFGAQGIVMPA